ncbi:MAG: glycosyltransferase, partial [Nocardioides sp.]|nr:glycosyltransferase [Nocardioides sp.]
MPASESPAVVALVVSHDGARWLPAVVDGVTGQTRPVDRVVAVDTTSRDDSVALLEAAFGPVHVVPGSTSYPAAVREGLARVDAGPHGAPGTAPDDWVWLLHDDANPDPGALEALLAAAAEHPEAAVLGPKLREWPSLRRLLEVGATISGTGRRETGLERGEYDQGQHDQVRRVLAVNT